MALRRSRSVWLTLATVMTSCSIGGLAAILAGMAELGSITTGEGGRPVFAIGQILAGRLPLFATGTSIGRTREAGRRIRRLEQDPDAKVRPLPAPFESFLFGPGH